MKGIYKNIYNIFFLNTTKSKASIIIKGIYKNINSRITFHFRYFSQKAVQGKKKRKDDDSDVSDTEFDEYLGGLFLHLNTQSRVWRERRNE